MTFNFGRLGRGLGRQDVALLVELEDALAIGIVAAAEEWAEPAGFIDHRFAAFRANMFAYLFFKHFAIFIAGCAEFTGRIGRAAKELSVFAESVDEGLFAVGAFIVAGSNLGLCVFHLLCGDVEVFLEWAVKIL